MKRLAFVLVLAAFLAGCTTSDDATVETLSKAGFHDVQPGGRAWFGCGEHDYFGRNFTARNANGSPVSGVVCCGFLKRCTVRF